MDLDEELLPDGKPPLILRARGQAGAGDLIELLGSRRDLLSERLLAYGALLFRGFAVTRPEDFRAAARAFSDGKPLSYAGGDSPRSQVAEHVYTSTECPSSVCIPLHNEMSYLPRFPRLLWFQCQQPAAFGGETTVADARRVRAAIPVEVRRRFEARGLRYHSGWAAPSAWLALVNRLVHLEKTWREAFESGDRRLVEARCRELELACRWLPSGALVTSSGVRPASLRHPVTGEVAWFNQAHLFRLTARAIGRLHYALARVLERLQPPPSHDATFGDGGDIDDASLSAVLDACDRHVAPVRWQAGDVLVLDNVLCMHGRNPFLGRRRVLVTMAG